MKLNGIRVLFDYHKVNKLTLHVVVNGKTIVREVPFKNFTRICQDVLNMIDDYGKHEKTIESYDFILYPGD
jgi:hypothetical protein